MNVRGYNKEGKKFNYPSDIKVRSALKSCSVENLQVLDLSVLKSGAASWYWFIDEIEFYSVSEILFSYQKRKTNGVACATKLEEILLRIQLFKRLKN